MIQRLRYTSGNSFVPQKKIQGKLKLFKLAVFKPTLGQPTLIINKSGEATIPGTQKVANYPNCELLGLVYIRWFFTLYHGIHHHFSPPFWEKSFGTFSFRIVDSRKSKKRSNTRQILSWRIIPGLVSS